MKACRWWGLAYLLRRNGMVQWLKERRRLENIYLGREYDSEIDSALRAASGVSLIETALRQKKRRGGSRALKLAPSILVAWNMVRALWARTSSLLAGAPN